MSKKYIILVKKQTKNKNKNKHTKTKYESADRPHIHEIFEVSMIQFYNKRPTLSRTIYVK